jgi:hypothetical protein
MQITVDDDTFHEWALDRGYVRLKDITTFARLIKDIPHDLVEIADRAAELPIAAFRDMATVAGDNFDDQVAALDTPLDPVPTSEEAVAAVRLLLAHKGTKAAQDILKPYGVTRVADVPAARRAELIAAAEKALGS